MYFSVAKLLIIFVEANLLQIVAGKFDVLSFYSEVDLSFENFENCHSPQLKLDVSYKKTIVISRPNQPWLVLNAEVQVGLT